MPGNGRSATQVRKEIALERDQLAEAVEDLRGAALDVNSQIRSKLPLIAAGAAGVGFVIAGGIGATARYFARREREAEEKARFGRFRVLYRG
jgi:hypothetical protein